MKNRILKALPSKEFKSLSPYFESGVLSKGALLHEAGRRIKHVYFPEETMISYLSGTANGETIEVCVIGNEGVVGITSLFSDASAFHAIVQIPGLAYSIDRDILRKEFKRSETLHRLLLQYTNALLTQIAQTSVCNKFHSVEARFCRWLLTADDRSGASPLRVTQDELGRVLGSRRASVSVVAGKFLRNGAIRYSRGVIEILDRKNLESSACECYETISAAHDK